MHYTIRAGEVLHNTYTACTCLGVGTFGTVVLASDQRGDREVAIKVVRAIRKYSEEAQVEANIIEDIHKVARGKSVRIPVVELLDRFEHRGHTCLVFERLGPSLYDALKVVRRPWTHTSSTYFCLRSIQHVARRVLEALSFCHMLGLTHTDLKPENILFCRDGLDRAGLLQWQETKIIDFGGATFDDESHSSVICTRQYRPPEVTLGMGWDTPVDMWSTGCILAELYIGHVLFPTHDEAEHLALMERLLGTIPPVMAEAASRSAQRAWFRHSFLYWPEISRNRDSVRRVRETPRLKDALCRDRPWTVAHDAFHSLILGLLEYIPARRLTADAALRHPFLNMDIPPELY